MLTEGSHIIKVKDGDIETHTSKKDEVLKEIKKINTRLTDQDDKIKSLAENVVTRLEHWPSTRLQTNNNGGSENTKNSRRVEVEKRKKLKSYDLTATTKKLVLN